MHHLLVQVLTLGSGLLVNFLTPLLFGLEQYGLFIKANILVFFFHKLTDIVSEPLISQTDIDLIFPISCMIGGTVFLFFLLTNLFINAGSPVLLASMLYSNSFMLVLYAHRYHRELICYLIVFILLYLFLLVASYYNLLFITITDILIFTNALPPALGLFLLILYKKIKFSWNNVFLNSIKIMKLIPTLFSLTLVNNFFTNIIPFYLSFILPPNLLGLFRVQISIIQSVAAVFPVNIKAIHVYFVNETKNNCLLERMMRLSMNYFYVLALIGFFGALYQGHQQIARVFLFLPVFHLAIILERYLFSIGMKYKLMVINTLITVLACLLMFKVHTLSQMILLYASGVSLYLLLMLITIHFQYKWMVTMIACLTPLAIYLSIHSAFQGCMILTGCALVVFAFNPINKNALSLIGNRI